MSDMGFSEYSRLAIRTASSPTLATENAQLICAALGLTGEAGEVADHIKKFIYHGHDLDRGKLIKEAGDVLWYVNLLASALGISLEEVAAQNISKLEKRYPGGEFTAERSRNRAEYHHVDGHELRKGEGAPGHDPDCECGRCQSWGSVVIE